jgi:subtilase family serine protease
MFTCKLTRGLSALALTILTLICLLPAANAADLVNLDGIVGAKQLGQSPAVSPDQSVPLVFGLRIRNQDQLEQLITAQSNPTSPFYHRWLTAAQFEATYSPTQADVDTVSAYLRDHGIRVVGISPNRLLIEALATAANVDNVFGVQLRQVADGFANSKDPQLPTDIAKIVQSINGLDSGTMMKSKTKAPKSHQADHGGIVYTPAAIATAYNFANSNNANLAHPEAALTGSGMTIAIVGAYGYNPQDLSDYYNKFHIKHTGKITNIPIGGPTQTIALETTLDLEQASAQAPAANVLMYMAQTPRLGTLDQAFNQVVCDNEADVVSFSWGLPDLVEGWAQILTMHEIFEQAAAQGIAIFVASGDDGAYYQDGPFSDPQLVSNYPSCDPLVTAVGGTTLRMDKSKRLSEVAWSGSGGGIAAYFDRPAWQRGKGVPEYGWYAPANQKRVGCDVSLNADPETGYATCFMGQTGSIGGTSAAAPNWAALWCLAQQAAHCRIGGANQTIYAIANSGAEGAAVFHDITDGDNGGDAGPGYKAGVGWDYPTGWGTPDGMRLIRWLVKHQPAAIADDLPQ